MALYFLALSYLVGSALHQLGAFLECFFQDKAGARGLSRETGDTGGLPPLLFHRDLSRSSKGVGARSPLLATGRPPKTRHPVQQLLYNEPDGAASYKNDFFGSYYHTTVPCREIPRGTITS